MGEVVVEAKNHSERKLTSITIGHFVTFSLKKDNIHYFVIIPVALPGRVVPV
jgi:high-affinity K+ transport system ATPase subunit B